MTEVTKINDWTHKGIKIKDIRKNFKFYTLLLDVKDNNGEDIITYVAHNILEEIITSYFMKPMIHITRQEILDLKWNVYLTQGFYIKIDKYSKEATTFYKDNHPNKYYISYLDIETLLANSIFYNVELSQNSNLNTNNEKF